MEKKYFADTVLMVRPSYFRYNIETASNNKFQKKSEEEIESIQEKAVQEFNSMVSALEANNINVIVEESDPIHQCPDAVFPNNWISLHEDGTLITYPMFAPARRKERNAEIITRLQERFHYTKHIALENFESKNIFLEGTGSMVFDRENKLVFACRSPRTDESILQEFCKATSFRPIVFDSFDSNGDAIYHTNVMMAMGHDFAVICLSLIRDDEQRYDVISNLENAGKEILDITFEQMNQFAGNMLELKNTNDEYVFVMSNAAYQSLTKNQLDFLRSRTKILPVSIPTIETIGGGSARCMMAEVMKPE